MDGGGVIAFTRPTGERLPSGLVRKVGLPRSGISYPQAHPQFLWITVATDLIQIAAFNIDQAVGRPLRLLENRPLSQELYTPFTLFRVVECGGVQPSPTRLLP